MQMRRPAFALGLGLFALLLFASDLAAHGERAQQANIRMRSINWYDVTIGPNDVAVGDKVVIKGRFRTSKFWPDHLPSVEGRVFLNVGSAGPNFVRKASTIDGVSMVQSTQLALGTDYAFEIQLVARKPGRFHVHPVMNVLDAGTMVGPGRWIEVGGAAADFTNTVETMFGREINLETHNLSTIFAWHGLWFVIGAAWLGYWLRNRPVMIPRMRAVEKAEETEGDGDAVITDQDRYVAVGFIVVCLVIILAGFQWAESKYPVTTPLRTAKVNLPAKPLPAPAVSVELVGARYRIPGRSFEMDLDITNHSKEALQISEFATANIRFINANIKQVKALDSHDLIAPQGLRVTTPPIAPGETTKVTVFAEDAMWETQRLTRMINDPDSVIAGLLFFQAPNGEREIIEIGGRMLPVFN